MCVDNHQEQLGYIQEGNVPLHWHYPGLPLLQDCCLAFMIIAMTEYVFNHEDGKQQETFHQNLHEESSVLQF